MVIGADDLIINKNAFKISIDYLNFYKKAGLSSALVYQLNNDYSLKKIIKTPVISNKARFFAPKAIVKEIENYGPFINGTLTIVRTEYFKKVLVKYPLLEQLSDICAFYCIAINHGVIFIPKAFGGYRYQGNESYGSYLIENITNIRGQIYQLQLLLYIS